jgi:hypothetical protein
MAIAMDMYVPFKYGVSDLKSRHSLFQVIDEVTLSMALLWQSRLRFDAVRIKMLDAFGDDVDKSWVLIARYGHAVMVVYVVKPRLKYL